MGPSDGSCTWEDLSEEITELLVGSGLQNHCLNAAKCLDQIRSEPVS